MNDATTAGSRAVGLLRDDLAASGTWRADLRDTMLGAIADFLHDRCATALTGSRVEVAEQVLRELLADGKCLRSSFMYLGWRCAAPTDAAAIRAAASLELLHAFALIQDDVMDGSALRRGRPTAHRLLEGWHRHRKLPGSSARYGESAAVLLGDLCLVWAEQMLRESGLSAGALSRVWPRYDAMRVELAVGQFADLVNHTAQFPTLEDVLDVARRKSGNYTVRRPLEIGAVLAGCDDEVLAALGDYGEAIGEAFQMRDDLLGVFGAPTDTGKPAAADLTAQKATTVVMAAHRLADRAQRKQLREFMTAVHLDAVDVCRWQQLIADSGAADWLERLIEERRNLALRRLDHAAIAASARTALADMATACTKRSA